MEDPNSGDYEGGNLLLTALTLFRSLAFCNKFKKRSIMCFVIKYIHI